jgi:hypothetical protein
MMLLVFLGLILFRLSQNSRNFDEASRFCTFFGIFRSSIPADYLHPKRFLVDPITIIVATRFGLYSEAEV